MKDAYMTKFDERTIPVSGASAGEVSRPVRPVIGQTFDAVLFDMDGTLIDSTPAVRRAWFAWCAERGLDPSFLEGAHGQPARDIVGSLVPTEEFDDAFERIQQIEIAEVADVTVLPGAAEALSAIGENRKAIVTSCTRPLATARIMASGLAPPRVVVTSDDVVRGKPNPEPFALGAKRLGFDPGRCLVVEDAPSGLRSAHDAGCTTLAVAGTHTSASLRADLVIASLVELEFSATAGGIHIARHTSPDR
ncbi:HAD-IA family hydrolase [Cryobacterium sp. PH31-O1]|uniref:HAD family hydrolase n=1 Tax=Cryobacterium sp. PH31-O1 TaxID=3046306 RepID=UPI0024BAC4EA|nr:HAD-IA family hydrolase [Cryobacterium sp. PH31-O1]MDJ0337297.1 HAD-IA family hydrolase [Cryobacterium sp. PH31-O1]